MSHFTVLVIGPDPEEQLAPFHEFECTGHDDKYVIDVDKTEEVQKKIDEYAARTGDEKVTDPLKEALEWEGLEDRVVENESDVDTSDTHKYGYAIAKDGKLIKAVRRTNPNRQWDWYVLGGRWTGHLKLKADAVGGLGEPGLMTGRAPKGYADQAEIGDVDLEGMRDEAGERAAAKWDKVDKLIGHLPAHKPWKEFLAAREKAGDDVLPMEESRDAYWAQPRCVAWKEGFKDDNTFGWRESADEFLISRDVYIANARAGALSTFAVLKEGEWYERGRMGWWGCVSDEKDDWPARFGALLDGLAPDTLVSVYDCHI